jgi:hypothetical protein
MTYGAPVKRTERTLHRIRRFFPNPISYVQLDDPVVQRGADPRPDRVEGQPLDPGRLGLELGEHRRRRRLSSAVLAFGDCALDLSLSCRDRKVCLRRLAKSPTLRNTSAGHGHFRPGSGGHILADVV